MLDTVIFDMDGLLIDSEPLWADAMTEVFATVGVAVSPEMALQTTGLRTTEVIHYWYNQFRWKGKSKEQIAEEIIEATIQKVISGAKAMEGLHYILDFFQQKNFKMGLASSSPLRFIETVLSYLDIAPYFNAVASAELEPYGKPHPAVYLACAEKLQSSPLECVAFEDSINGMIAAKAARMKVVVVPEEHNRHNQRYALADLQLLSLLHFKEAHLETLNQS